MSNFWHNVQHFLDSGWNHHPAGWTSGVEVLYMLIITVGLLISAVRRKLNMTFMFLGGLAALATALGWAVEQHDSIDAGVWLFIGLVLPVRPIATFFRYRKSKRAAAKAKRAKGLD